MSSKLMLTVTSVVSSSGQTSFTSMSSPTDLPTPTNNVFVDFEFDTTENLFFMKMAGN